MKTFKASIIFIILFVALSITFAGSPQTIVNVDQISGDVAFTSADTSNVNSTGFGNGTPIPLNGRRTIFVTPTYPFAAGCNCTVGVALGTYDQNTGSWKPKAWNEVAFVESATLSWDGSSTAQKGVELSTAGCSHFMIRLPQFGAVSGTIHVLWSAY